MQQFNIDISQPRGPLVLYVSQGDSLSRFFSVTVTDNGAAYTPPDGAIYTVRFGAPGMPAGWYDTITEVGGGAHPAVVLDENTYTVEIAEQALGTPGENVLVLIVSGSTGYTLASWPFELQVAAVPGYDAPEATVYYNALSEQVAQVLSGVQESAASASAAAASASQAQQYAESINPANFATAAQGAKADSAVQTVNGSAGPAASVTTQNLEYSVGDTIVSTNASFNPNTVIGGTWTQKTQVLFEPQGPTQLQLQNGFEADFPTSCRYSVTQNGMCIVTLAGLKNSTFQGGAGVIASVPNCAQNAVVETVQSGGNARISVDPSDGETTNLVYGTLQISTPAYATLVYPVALSLGTTYYVWTKTA